MLSAMDLEEAIKGRRSVRSFKDESVDEEDLELILEMGRWAPSAGNSQPLEMVVVKKFEKRKELSRACNNQRFVAEAPVDIVVCANVPRTVRNYGDRGRDMYVFQDTAAATQNMLLIAYSLGYGTCWVGAFRDEEVAKVVKAPENVDPHVVIALGKPVRFPSAPNRRSLDDIVHEDTF